MESKKRRSPFIAAVLSLITPGLGQIYNGEIRKGLIFYLALTYCFPLILLARLQYSFVGMIVVMIALITSCFASSVEAFFTARKKEEIVLKSYSKWYFYILFVIIAFSINAGIEGITKADFRTLMGTKAYKMASGAMEPTILIGDRVIAGLKYYDHHSPKRGDIIALKYPENPSRTLIKRVIAIENDTIESKDKTIYVNGKKLHEPYVQHVDNAIMPRDKGPRDNFGPITVPKDKIFVMGDNRDESYDSRFWGFLDKNQIKAKALYLYWSEKTSRIGKKLQ